MEKHHCDHCGDLIYFGGWHWSDVTGIEQHICEACLAAEDRRLYGTSYERKRLDGTLERIDPTTLIIKK